MIDSSLTPVMMPLGGRFGWPTTDIKQMDAGGPGLQLAALPDGPLSLGWQNASLAGGLVLPRGFALTEDNTLLLLTRESPWRIKRYDSQKQAFVPLVGIGSYNRPSRTASTHDNAPAACDDGVVEHADPRIFRDPGNIAVAGQNLYVADTGNQRIQVFLLANLALRHVWQMPDWNPVDVAARGEWAYILDQKNGRVYRHYSEANALECVIDGARNGAVWTRVLVDRTGKIYLLNSSNPQQLALDAFDPHSRAWDKDPITDAGQIRDRFDAPPITLYFDRRGTPGLEYGILCLPESLARACDRQLPTGGNAETPLMFCPPAPTAATASATTVCRNCPPRPELDQLYRSGPNLNRLFDRDGNPVSLAADDLVEPHLYQGAGYWVSAELDSHLYRCQFHRIELHLEALPPGTRVHISTLSSSDKLDKVDLLALDANWELGYQAAGPMQSGTGLEDPSLLTPRTDDFLVQSRPGRYLYLKVELTGDDFGSPRISGMRVHYPRQSYLNYLPAVYSDENSRWFVERFLSIFQTEWDHLETQINQTARYFDPAAVPAEGGFLDQLATWVALPLEETWTAEQKRRLLEAVPQYYPRRGTIAGLRAFLQVYLEIIGGDSWDQPPEPTLSPSSPNLPCEPLAQSTYRPPDYPILIEGFRERQRFMLSVPDQAVLGEGGPLWGPEAVGRLQLGVYARAGEARLVSTGDPERDLFHQYAHRFRVFIPACWVRSDNDEKMLRRALDSEKPAESAYDLCLVEPRFRVGVQSTIGLDTIIGGIPPAFLSCADALPAAPPSQAPANRLGYDTVLGGKPDQTPSVPLQVTVRLP